MNGCPCGNLGNPHRECRCLPAQIEKYRTKISGPLLDRIDLHVEVPLVNYKELSDDKPGESSASIRERVIACREVQLQRFRKHKHITSNGAMPPRVIRDFCKLNNRCGLLLEKAMTELNFSARAHDRILKVSRTLADMGGSAEIREDDLLEAIQYRTLDRKLWG